MSYRLFRSGRKSLEQVGFYELTRWLNEGSPPIAEAQVTVHHVHHGAKPRRR